MTTNKHTPGPWDCIAAVHKSHRPVVGVLATNNRIADVGDAGQTFEERNANARLIAAAPEMLEALKNIKRVCDSAEPMKFMSELSKVVEPIANIIAKAEGSAE